MFYIHVHPPKSCLTINNVLHPQTCVVLTKIPGYNAFGGNLGMTRTKLNVWQSWVEIERYSVAYFNHVTAIEAL